MQKEMENLEFVQSVYFQFIDSLKNNVTKYWLILEDSSEEICNSNAFVEFSVAGSDGGLSTNYYKHNFFHHNELGRDVELQNTYIVLFEFPRDVMQISTHSEQLGLGSKPFDWYRDATTFPYGQFLID